MPDRIELARIVLARIVRASASNIRFTAASLRYCGRHTPHRVTDTTIVLRQRDSATRS